MRARVCLYGFLVFSSYAAAADAQSDGLENAPASSQSAPGDAPKTMSLQAIENPVKIISPQIVERSSCIEDYSVASARANERGTVNLKMIIGTDGVPHDVTVDTSSGYARLDDAAVACISRWRYTPATMDGVPVEIESHPSISFDLQ